MMKYYEHNDDESWLTVERHVYARSHASDPSYKHQGTVAWHWLMVATSLSMLAFGDAVVTSC